MTYVNGGYEEAPDEEEETNGAKEADDEGYDQVGQNPTGFKRRSSSGQRRKKARKLFGGTRWGE